MGECNFCTFEKLEDCIEVSGINIPFGNLDNGLRHTLWLDSIDGKFSISTTIAGPDGSFIADELSVEVKYCPVCGRELTK